MTGDVRLTGSSDLSGFESLDGVSSGARTADDHANAGRRERLVGIRAAVAGKDELHVLGGHELGRLNAGPAAARHVRVLDGFELQGVRIDDQEVRAAPEARIEVRLQGRLTGGDSDFHQSFSFLENCPPFDLEFEQTIICPTSRPASRAITGHFALKRKKTVGFSLRRVS